MNTVTSPDGSTVAYDQSGECPAPRSPAPAVPTGCGARHGGSRRTVPGAQHRILDGGFHEIPPELLVPVLQSFLTG